MKIKIEINSVFGKVLFALEKENNTIKDTLEQAIKEDANLEDTNLRNANLGNANLEDANLYNANLRNANLINANLEDANLEDAKNKETAILPIFCKWSYGIKGDLIVISCKEKTIEQWDLWFDSEEEYSTRRDTEDFKQIQAIYNALKSYYLTLNK